MKNLKNFYVYAKFDGSNEYELLKTAIFPFKYGMLLDQRLDEAYITIFSSPYKTFKPTTRIKIEIIEDAHEPEARISDVKHYIVASDMSTEMWSGCGYYKHQLYLIEPTKLLEGILCQSLTFTNVLGKMYTSAPASALSSATYIKQLETGLDQDNSNTSEFNEFKEKLREIYFTPVKNGTTVNVLSLNEMDALIKDNIVISGNIESTSGTLTITVDGVTNTYVLTDEQPQNIIIDKNAIFNYSITISTERIGTSTFPVEYFFNISFGITAVANKYPQKRYTITDCVNRILDLCQVLRGEETPKFTFLTEQAIKYNAVMSPDVSMTQCTLREALQVIGGYIHAEPRLGWQNPNNPQEYLENVIYFDEYGSTEEITTDAPYVYKSLSQSIGEYCTEVQTSAQNIVNSLDYAKGTISMPSRSEYVSFRTDTVNVRLTEENAYIPTLYPIQEVNKVEVIADGNIYDITQFVFEQHVYNSQLSSYNGAYPYSKAYGIYYTQGSKNINGLFYKAPADTFLGTVSSYFLKYSIVNIMNEVAGYEIINNEKSNINTLTAMLKFRVTYKPIYSASFAHGKSEYNGAETEFSRVYNQSENLIEMQYYGENIKGVASRLGNVEEERTYLFPRSVIPFKIGQIFDNKYISAISCELLPFVMKCTIALSQDFNRLSEYVGINSNKRVSQVSEREAYARNVPFKSYVIFTREDAQIGDTKTFAHCSENLRTLFSNGESGEQKGAISAAFAWSNENEYPVMLPVVSSAFGNMLEFGWEYKDNYSAGERVQDATKDASQDVQGYWQQDVAYTDYYGRIKMYNFALVRAKEAGASALLSPSADSDVLPGVSLTANDEIIKRAIISTYTGSYAFQYDNKRHFVGDTVKPYLMRKDSREKLVCSFTLEFKAERETASDLIIGSGIARNIPLVSGDTPKIELVVLTDKIGKHQQRISYTDYFSAGKGSIAVGGNIGEELSITPTFSGAIGSRKAWAIVTPATQVTEDVSDEDGNDTTQTITDGGEILLASNDISTLGQAIYVQFMDKIFS